MPAAPTTRSGETRRHGRKAVLLGVSIFILFVIVFAQAAFNLTFLRPSTYGQTLAFAAVSALIFLGLIALIFVWLRILVKLYIERQSGALGSKFRFKMVFGALVLSLGPVIALFFFSYGLMNRSIDKWFSRPQEEVRERTSQVTQLLTRYAGENAAAEAEGIAVATETQRAFRSGQFRFLTQELRRRQASLQGGFAIALLDGQPEASFQAPDTWPALREKLPLAAPGPSASFALGGKEYMLGSATVGRHGRIVVAMPLPAKYSEVLSGLETSQRKYAALRSQRKLVRQTYVRLLLLLTLMVLFASTWFALFLSKLVTRPVVALAEAMQAISGGRLDHRVEVAAEDELAELVASFNTMATELESNRQQIEASRKDLAGANVKLEAHGRQMETILESIPTGVLSLDAEGKVTHVNDALLRLFQPPSVEHAGQAGALDLAALYPAEFIEELRRLQRKADRMGSTSAQMELAVDSRTLVLAVTVASMNSLRYGTPSPRQRLGYVVVFEDLSELLKAQKQAAWREVARRIAHEIKNPLTPIVLSAERLRRHVIRGNMDEISRGMVRSCAEMISDSAETVRKLVDEFSTLARFPASQLRPSDLNAVITDTVKLFAGRLDGITLTTSLAKDLPPIMADPEAIKRVIANLVDNAAEAMGESLVRELVISTSVLGGKDTVELCIADSGHGVTPELKEKLFLPYFSTKQRGTGLGLAIVARIIEDHQGTIRVEENSPVGTRFILEFPAASETDRPANSAMHSAVADEVLPSP